MLAKNREQEEESKRARQYRLETLQAKKKGGVIDMLMEKKYLTQMMIHEQEKEIQMKQKRRMEIKRMEEEARLKKEQERIEREQKVREYYQQKLAEEAAEAKRAERLVKELERKEKEWISKLREAQVVQEEAFDQLETALHKEGSTPPSSTLKRGPGSILRSSNGHDHGSPQSKFQGSGGSVGSGPRGGREHDWGRRNESKEGSMDGGHSRASKDRDMDGRVGDDGNGLADSMSEMNMSDPVDAVEAEESHRKSLAASNVSALTRSSAASASKREGGGLTGPRSSTSAGSGSSSKKKVIASNGKKAH